MCSKTNKKLSLKADIIRYKPAVYAKHAKEKYVYFYVLDPESLEKGEPKLKRIRTKFNDFPSAKERDAAALRYRDEINAKLADGWNPLIEQSCRKSWTTTQEALNSYEHYLKKTHKDGIMKQSTVVDYQSRLNVFRKFIEQHNIHYIYMLDKRYIDSFLEYMYVDRDSCPRTRNNYLYWISSMCSFFVDFGYLPSNPALSIKNLKVSDKKRKALTQEDLKLLFDYLEANDQYFLLACMFHYYTLIRPNEMSYVKLSDINIKKQTVFVSAQNSKNGKAGVVTLPAVLIHKMLDLAVFSNPVDYFLFSDELKPGFNHAPSTNFAKRWSQIRKKLGFPDSYQFYSLKDTGITNIINKVGLNVAKDQARHSSVAVTNHYASSDQMHAHAELKNYD